MIGGRWLEFQKKQSKTALRDSLMLTQVGSAGATRTKESCPGLCLNSCNDQITKQHRDR
jgi:hypothetical protein